MEIYLCGNHFSIGPIRLVQLTRGSKDPFAPEIAITMAIAITIRFENGLCTHFCHCDPIYPIVIAYYMANVNEQWDGKQIIPPFLGYQWEGSKLQNITEKWESKLIEGRLENYRKYFFHLNLLVKISFRLEENPILKLKTKTLTFTD